MAHRLAAETSPYLAVVRGNASGEARRRDVPVPLSVGYAGCHSCRWAPSTGWLKGNRRERVR